MSGDITVSVDIIKPRTKLNSSIQSTLYTDYHFHAKSKTWKKQYSSKNNIFQRHAEYIKNKSFSTDVGCYCSFFPKLNLKFLGFKKQCKK